MDRIALVLGASGSFGSAVAAELERQGWQVRRWKRGTDMTSAALGGQLIVNGLNPPHYHNWAEIIPQITTDVLAAAKASGATVLVPGNVYPFGREPAPWTSKTPHRPVARKGAIRAEMERRYRSAAEAGDAKVILLRAGDFLGVNPAFAINQVTLRNVAKGKVSALGNPEVIRAHAYLPDLARAAAALVARDDLPAYLDLPFSGHSFSVNTLAADIRRLTGKQMQVSTFPTWIFGLLSPVWELVRELREMLYLFNHPHWMEDAELRQWLPAFSPTQWDHVLTELLNAKGVQ